MNKIGAIAAIAYPVMQMASQALIQVGGMEPPFAAPASEIVTFFAQREPTLFAIGGYLSILSLVAFLWFVGALWHELRAIEGNSGWLANVAAASGIVVAASLASPGGWPLAVFRVQEGLDPQIARMLFDHGNLNFANIWVALGSMVLAAALVLRRSQSHPRWLAPASIVLGAGLLLARAVWTSSIAFAPYLAFWLWLIVLGLQMWRRPQPGTERSLAYPMPGSSSRPTSMPPGADHKKTTR